MAFKRDNSMTFFNIDKPYLLCYNAFKRKRSMNYGADIIF